MLAPWGPPLVVQFADIVWKHTLNNSFITTYCQWELLETCDENDQLLIMKGFGKNKVYTTFTYISPFILDTKTQPCHCNFVIASVHITRETPKMFLKLNYYLHTTLLQLLQQLLQQLHVTPHKCCWFTANLKLYKESNWD